MDLGLAGRVALVCGSTKGLGRAVAKALAQEGARVAINGRHQDSVERVAQQLEAETTRTVVPLVADVGIPAEAEGMVERVARELGRLDILFCNASGPPAAPFSHQTADAFQRAVEVNLLSTVHLARAAVPVMRKVQWGRIICLASVAAKQPVPGLILSTTARAGVLGFAKALADEVAPEGITVNVVCPGFIATERIEDLTETRAKREHRSSQEVMREMVADIPISSVAAKQPVPGLILSTTARAGVLGFAKALADEVAPEGITVNVVCPGFIATERIEDLTETRAKREHRSSQEVMREMVADIPMGRMGRTDELAAAVVFLASERASYITGAVVQVDGGFTRSIF